MLTYRKVLLYLLGDKGDLRINKLNFIFNEQKEVEFIHINSEVIGLLYEKMKQLRSEIYTSYEHEDYLKEIFKSIKKSINHFFNSTEKYLVLFDNVLKQIVEDFKVIQSQFTELYNNQGKEIIELLKLLKKDYSNRNLFLEKISLYKNKEKTQCIVTRYKTSLVEYEGMPIMKAKDYLKMDNLVDEVFFIGSPLFFDDCYSKIFLAKKTYFIAYDFFENKVNKVSPFRNLKSELFLDTTYDNICLKNELEGQSFVKDFGNEEELVFPKNDVIEKHQNKNIGLKPIELVHANLVILSNNCYTFIPVNGEVRKINSETIEVEQVSIKDLNIGEWLIFRNNTTRDLIIDVANELIGPEYIKYRKSQKRWKKKLENALDLNGQDKLIKYLKQKGVKHASLINLKNWLDETRISMDSFPELLASLKFTVEDQLEIIANSKVLNSKHIEAGRAISKRLISELNDSIIEEMEEFGFSTFVSPLIKGASFNIEIVKEIDSKSIEVNLKDTLVIWRM